MTNKNDQLVVGMYANPDAAKDAADAVKAWDHKEHDVKLGAMAVITYDHKKGELRYDEIGQRSTKSGAGWGTALGAAVGLLTGGLGLIPGMALGAAAGGALGTLNHRSLGVTDEQQAALMDALKTGGAGLGVMADDFEVEPLKAQLADTGADIGHYVVDAEVAAAITGAAAAQAAASKAVDAAVAVDVDEETADVERLAFVTGMGPEAAEAMVNVGIEKPSDVLELAALPDGRAAISEATGLDADVVLASAKKLDLMRVDGVGIKYAALLLAAGVDTVPELATRNAANLTKKCAEVNATDNIVEELPSEEEVSGWVAQAKELPRMLFY